MCYNLSSKALRVRTIGFSFVVGTLSTLTWIYCLKVAGLFHCIWFLGDGLLLVAVLRCNVERFCIWHCIGKYCGAIQSKSAGTLYLNIEIRDFSCLNHNLGCIVREFILFNETTEPSLHCISAQVCSHVDLPGPLYSQSCASTIQRCSVVVHTCNPVPWEAGKGSFVSSRPV